MRKAVATLRKLNNRFRPSNINRILEKMTSGFLYDGKPESGMHYTLVPGRNPEEIAKRLSLSVTRNPVVSLDPKKDSYCLVDVLYDGKVVSKGIRLNFQEGWNVIKSLRRPHGSETSYDPLDEMDREIMSVIDMMCTGLPGDRDIYFINNSIRTIPSLSRIVLPGRK